MTQQRVALVTGGGSGMGEATCYTLADNNHAIAVLDINSANAERVATAITTKGGQAIAVTADITRPGQITTALENIHRVLGPISILVNNAGLEDFTAFDAIDSDNWDRIIEVNLKGNYNMTQAVLPDMKAQRWGRIINFTSIAAQTGAPNMVHYSAAKGGVVAMTRSLALELGRYGITVNAVAPGLINTAMAQRAIEEDRFPVPVEQMVATFPIPRMGEPHEAAAAVAFFASEAAGYITAQLLGINGGTAV